MGGCERATIREHSSGFSLSAVSETLGLMWPNLKLAQHCMAGKGINLGNVCVVRACMRQPACDPRRGGGAGMTPGSAVEEGQA